jgi:integrase
VIDDAQAAENELAGVGGPPEPMERYFTDAIAFGVAFVDIGLGRSADWDRGEFAGKTITEIDDLAIEAFIKGLPHSPRGKANIRTKLSQLLNFCIRQKWISMNPADGIKVPLKRHRIEILEVDQAETLLRSGERFERPQNVVPYLLVSLFAGLRPGEAEQLTWEQIHFETSEIEVLGATSKTREERFVHMEPALIEWLLPYRKVGGPIVGSNFAKDIKQVRRFAGFGTDKNTAACSWPKDVLRHTYASYWLPIHKDRAHLAELMGNSLAVIKACYKRAIPETRIQENLGAADVDLTNEEFERIEAELARCLRRPLTHSAASCTRCKAVRGQTVWPSH